MVYELSEYFSQNSIASCLRQDDVKLDRYMQCVVCRANNVMTLTDPVK